MWIRITAKEEVGFLDNQLVIKYQQKRYVQALLNSKKDSKLKNQMMKMLMKLIIKKIKMMKILR